MNKGKRIALVSVVMLTVICSIVGYIAIITKANNNNYLESIDLGKKYLFKEKYEEAILAFEKALNIIG